MAALQELIPASFRGVRFLTPKGNVESGRHAIKHEYPDSNTRYVEDNGRIVPDLKLTCVIHGPDALARLRSFERALQTPGPGTLMHPILGRQFVQPGKYHYAHEDSSVGVYSVECEFHVTGPPSFPGQISGIAAAISGLSASTVGSMFKAFSAGFDIGSASQITQASVAGNLTSVATVLATSYGSVSGVIVGADTIGRTPEALLADPEALAGILQSMVRAPFAAPATAIVRRAISYGATEPVAVDTDARAVVTQDQLWSGFRDLRDAGRAIVDEAAAMTANTLDLATRQTAKLQIGTTVEQVAFACLCEASAGKTYQTADLVANDIDTLTTIHSAIVDIERTAPDERKQLTNLLTETVRVLEKKQVTVPRVTQYRTSNIPASVLAYQAYETDDNLFTLVALNAGRNPILYDGVVSILNVE